MIDNEFMFLLVMLAALAGSMIFFAATVAPTVFTSLAAQPAGTFLRAFFPKYYLWGFALALLAGLLAIWVSLPIAAALLIVAALFMYSRQGLMPQINQARDVQQASDQGDDKTAGARFERLHRLSVMINLLQLIVIVASMGWLIWAI